MARIMIVDDSIMARRRLKHMLLEGGHEVLCEASNGLEAVLQNKHYRPDIITMDMTMPGKDGLTASKQILSEFPDARIVMVSSISDHSKIMESSKAGVFSYLLKPFTKEQILAAISDALNATDRRPIAVPQG
ncbi:MAG: response regulator transcription factor [Acidimicrobiia bacterium]|nr:response regulator transcription factor [Acidimicrobiia bacterium]